MAVTSQLRPVPGYGEFVVQEWQAANLLKPSVIKPVLATVEQVLITRILGRLQAQDRVSIHTALASILG